MKVTVLTGGVGGAKFVLGLQMCEGIESVTAIVNTGDDFRHLGLHISPDIDTLLYTLSGKANRELGWGRDGESWQFMDALKSLDGPDWFNLGDGDVALHVWRTHRLNNGDPLSAITADIAKSWGIGAKVLPMSDNRVATWVDTEEGLLAFQNYFVERQCKPALRDIRFEGASEAKPAPGVVQALAGADAIFVAPSNPWLSVDPVLAILGVRKALEATDAPVVAISPLVGGRAVKGPTTKLMAELGIEISNAAITDHYAPWLSGLLHDSSDAPPPDIAALAADTLMRDDDDKRRVAEAAIAFAKSLRR